MLNPKTSINEVTGKCMNPASQTGLRKLTGGSPKTELNVQNHQIGLSNLPTHEIHRIHSLAGAFITWSST
jgi:hypothetical protein